MGVVLQSRAITLWGWFLLTVVCCSQRVLSQTTPANPPKPCTAPCPSTPQPDTATPVQQFPYPGETKKAAPQTPDPDAPPSAPNTPSRPAANGGPAKQFPYPGEAKTPDSDGSSSSSSSSPDASDPSAPASNSENSADSRDDTKPDNFPRRRLPKVKNLQTDEELESEDLTVARFYRDRGNWNAAYMRSKDAVKHGPDDPDAHLILAETAQKLNKKEEAVAEYSAILKLDSSESQIKTARKALDRLK